jgi:hypothetical protein
MRKGNDSYRDNGRLLAAKEMLQVANLQCDVDERVQALARFPSKLTLASFWRDIAFHIHTHSCTLTSRPAEAPDNTATVRKCHDLSLILADAPVDWVRVVKVVSFSYGEGYTSCRRCIHLSGERRRRDEPIDVVNKLLRSLRRYFLIVVSREERAAVLRVVPIQDLTNAPQLPRLILLIGRSNNI